MNHHLIRKKYLTKEHSFKKLIFLKNKLINIFIIFVLIQFFYFCKMSDIEEIPKRNINKFKAFLFRVPNEEEAVFVDKLCKYKSISYIVGARTDEGYSNIYASFYRATNIPQKKFSNVEILPLKPTKEENISFVKESGTVWLEMSFSKKNKQDKSKCLLSIYAELTSVRNEIAQFIKIIDNQIAQLSETGNKHEIEKEEYSAE